MTGSDCQKVSSTKCTYLTLELLKFYPTKLFEEKSMKNSRQKKLNVKAILIWNQHS